MENGDRLRKAGVKVIGNFFLWGTALNMIISSVKNPGFRNKLVVTFKISVCSFELKSPSRDNKIFSVEHFKEGKKYSNYLKLPEVKQ
jgi:hypothetical protein